MFKIIHIMDHCPAYEEHDNLPRPEINWNTPHGEWVGIAGYDWPDLVGIEVLKIEPEIRYEVWQPDLRADRIYSHSFSNGLIHTLFPAVLKKERSGLKKKQNPYSQSIIDSLNDLAIKKRKEDQFIIECGFGYTIFLKKILKFRKHFPILREYTGHPYNLTTLNWTINPLKLLHRTWDFFTRIRSLTLTDFLFLGDYFSEESKLL